MTGGSQQLRIFRRAIRQGFALDAAALWAGISMGEARLIHTEDLKNPPPPEAFELLYDPDAVAAASQPQENDMARPKKMAREPETMDAEAGEGSGIDGEYKRPDAALAFKIYDEQIKPKETHLATIKGDMSEPYQQIKNQAHFSRKVLNFIIGLENEEDAKRDHLLLTLSEGLKHRKLFLPRDLVTMAQGEDGADVIPSGDRAEDGDMFADDGDDFDEADEAELAQQESRGKPKPGTGAAAIAAMKAAAAEAPITVN